MKNDLDMPFERQQWELSLADANVAGGLVVMAGVTDVPDRGTLPTLIFRFAKPDGTGFYPPFAVVVEEDQMVKLAQLVASATSAAVSEASKR